jgi:hypothetical protein
MTRRLTLLLLAGNVLLAGVLLWLWVGPDGRLRGIHWQPPAAIRPDLGRLATSANIQDDAMLAGFMRILDRPLFSPSRRPPPPPPPPKVVVPVPPDPLNTIHLFGIFGSGASGGVLARIDGKTRRVQVSDRVGEWTLKEIQSRAVLFTKGAESRTVSLVQARQGAGGAPPRPAFSAPVQPSAAPAAPPAPAPAPSSVPPPTPGGNAAKPPASGQPANPFVIGGSS